MAESRIRRGHPRGFFALYRSAAQDNRLSLAARGLFGLMMSLPDDWEFTVSGLATFAGCGKDKVRRLLGELETVGYLIREQTHDKGGRFSGNDYVLQDEAPSPLSGKPDNGEAKKPPLSENTDDGENRQRETPSTENPTQRDIDSLTDNIPLNPPKGEKRKREKTAPKYQPEWFERFWAKYPPRQGTKSHKREAARAWDKLRPSMETCHIMSKALDKENWPKGWHDEDGRYIPLPSTWLNNERWKVERVTPTTEVSRPPAQRPMQRQYHIVTQGGEQIVVFDEPTAGG